MDIKTPLLIYALCVLLFMLPNYVAQIAKYTLEGIMYGDKKGLKTWSIENNF